MSNAEEQQGSPDVRGDSVERPEDDSGVGSKDRTVEVWTVAQDGQEAQEEAEEEVVLSDENRLAIEVAIARYLMFADAAEGKETLQALNQLNVIDTARANDKHPAYLTWAVPEEWKVNIDGYDALKDLYFLVRVPREYYEHMEKGGE